MSRTSYLVIGSGASATMATLALSGHPDAQVTVLDLGSTLDRDRKETLARVAGQSPQDWSDQDLDTISSSPVRTSKGALPQKRSYGSDYPFRDVGQNTGINQRGTHADVVSSAYGGFTNVWGAQLMPFSRSTFDRWPISWQEMEPHYRAILDEVPLAAEVDDLAQHFPLLNERSGLPPLGARTNALLSRYEKHRDTVNDRGVTVGRARLAFHARECVRCGLCMTGCPYSLIYSAAHTMEKLRRLPNVRHHDRLLVERVGQDGEQVFARCRNTQTGERVEFRADRLLIGAGGMGTTRLVLGSLPSPPRSIDLLESVQFLVPFLSSRAVADVCEPGVSDFTLNQFNLLVQFDNEVYDTSQVHCYPYNSAVLDALPAVLRTRAAAGLTRQLLSRLTVGLGYLPSWASPALRLSCRPGSSGGLPELDLTAVPGNGGTDMLRRVLGRLTRSAPKLDLWPVLTHVRASAPGSSYHFGGSFPHSGSSARPLTATDRSGRLPCWDRIHLVDGSVFPSIPSTTFTMTVMANAHRIATEVASANGMLRGVVLSSSRG